MGPALVTYVTEPCQYAQIGETVRFFCEGFIGKYCLLFQEYCFIYINCYLKTAFDVWSEYSDKFTISLN
jgi:hypothetical protein